MLKVYPLCGVGQPSSSTIIKQRIESPSTNVSNWEVINTKKILVMVLYLNMDLGNKGARLCMLYAFKYQKKDLK